MSVRRRSMPGVVAAVVRASEEVAEFAAESLAEKMRRDVRVKTGYTKSTIKVEKVSRSRRVKAGGAAVFLEFGTSRMAAHPFVRPNVRVVRKEIKDFAQKTIRKNLKGGLKG